MYSCTSRDLDDKTRVWDAQTRLSEILAPAEAHAESWTDISIRHDMSR
eukprot:COSAG03_NODE_13947_length_483_cov_0.729167_1_plen_47_part_10